MHAGHAGAGGDQQVAVGGFADLKDLAIGEAFAGGIPAGGGPVKEHQAGIVEADPNAAGVILVDGIGRVAGQAFGLAVHHEDIVAPAAEAAVGADPEIALAVFEEAADHIDIVGIIAARSHEAVALEACHPVVGAGPDVAVLIRP